MADTADFTNNAKLTQYIGVMINNEQYGIDISYVDNIVRMQRITRVPKSQPFFPGVINLRGEIIPVMSLRRRFGLEDDVFTTKTRILILKPELQASIGFIVDEVKEVLSLSDADIDHVAGPDDRNTYVTGVGKHAKGLISIMNVPAVITEKEAT